MDFKKSIQLTTTPFNNLLKNGEAIDFRLDEVAWRDLKEGDYIEFWEDITGWQKAPAHDARKILVEIRRIYRADTFLELFDMIEADIYKIGDKIDLLTDLRKWWSEDVESNEGVLAFHVELITAEV